MVFLKHKAGKREDAVNYCSTPLSHPIIPSKPSYSGCNSAAHADRSNTNMRNRKAFVKYNQQISVIKCRDAGDYLPDTLYSKLKLTCYCEKLRETVDPAVRWLCKLKQHDAGPPQHCPAALAHLLVHTRHLLFCDMMSYPIHIIINSVIELWESNTRQANYLFLQVEMKTKRPDMHLEALLVQHMLFV